jgi:uncharacterized protein (DUF1501 family)
MTTSNMNRRRFLQLSGGLAGLGIMGIPAPRAFAAPFTDYRCLVNVFLLGGNDAFNLVVPRSDAEYNVYAASRQNLSIPQTDLLPIVADNPDGALYGLHPNAGELQALFESGDLAVIANIGPLLEPTTRADYLNKNVDLPPQLFSHNDQQDQWQSLKGKSSLTTGWAGRIADNLQADVGSQRLPINISSSGTTLYQAGESTVPYTVGVDGANAYGALAPDVQFGPDRRAAFESHLANGFRNIHARALAAVHQRSLALADLVNDALAGLPELATTFPASRLGAQLHIVARLLAVRSDFEASRQIFYVATGGFDTHDNQNDDQPDLFADISASLGAFNTAMNEIGLLDQVVTFTQSDFGRTLTSNGDGTDHGWGSHQLVMGGPVLGRKIYGTMPLLEIGGADDVSGGRMIPTTSADQYAATLARWFGVAESELATIAPHLPNFAVQDLGFLA